MKYVGSKNRLAKYIAPILQKTIDEHGTTTYYEPFADGANIIDKIRIEKLCTYIKKENQSWI